MSGGSYRARMDSEEPPNRVACSGDIDEVVREADARRFAAWMSARRHTGRRADRPDIRGDLRPRRSELLVASCSDAGIVSCCTLSAGIEVLAGSKGPHICTSSRCDQFAGPGCQLPLIESLPPCRAWAQGCASCGSTATRTCIMAYTSSSDSPTSFSIPAGIQPSSQNA